MCSSNRFRTITSRAAPSPTWMQLFPAPATLVKTDLSCTFLRKNPSPFGAPYWRQEARSIYSLPAWVRETRSGLKQDTFYTEMTWTVSYTHLRAHETPEH